MSLWFTSVLTADIVSSFRNTKSCLLLLIQFEWVSSLQCWPHSGSRHRRSRSKRTFVCVPSLVRLNSDSSSILLAVNLSRCRSCVYCCSLFNPSRPSSSRSTLFTIPWLRSWLWVQISKSLTFWTSLCGTVRSALGSGCIRAPYCWTWCKKDCAWHFPHVPELIRTHLLQIPWDLLPHLDVVSMLLTECSTPRQHASYPVVNVWWSWNWSLSCVYRWLLFILNVNSVSSWTSHQYLVRSCLLSLTSCRRVSLPTLQMQVPLYFLVCSALHTSCDQPSWPLDHSREWQVAWLDSYVQPLPQSHFVPFWSDPALSRPRSQFCRCSATHPLNCSLALFHQIDWQPLIFACLQLPACFADCSRSSLQCQLQLLT